MISYELALDRRALIVASRGSADCISDAGSAFPGSMSFKVQGKAIGSILAGAKLGRQRDYLTQCDPHATQHCQ